MIHATKCAPGTKLRPGAAILTDTPAELLRKVGVIPVRQEWVRQGTGPVVSGLQYFTHTVDDHVYGAWYRIISPAEIEVIGVGMLESARYTGLNPESTARSVLENFVRQRIVDGVPIPNVDTPSSHPSRAL